jgi:flavodoxin
MSGKKIAVRYYSKSGNTKKLAERIAAVAGCNAEMIEVVIFQLQHWLNVPFPALRSS